MKKIITALHLLWCGIWRTPCKAVVAVALMLWGIKPNCINWHSFAPIAAVHAVWQKPKNLSDKKWEKRDPFYDRFEGVQRPIWILGIIGLMILLNPWSPWTTEQNRLASWGVLTCGSIEIICLFGLFVTTIAEERRQKQIS